jgi:hypothetical protein
MKIVFNKVTWYSKLAAVFVLFIFVTLISFYLGSYYEQKKILIQNTSAISNVGNVKNVQSVPFVNKTNPVVPVKPTKPKPVQPPPGVACTMEAKLCPDGSYVARTGLNCEFTPCP